MAHVADVTIQASQVSADLTDYPVTIELKDITGFASFWSTVANGGGDIRCFKAGGTVALPREVAKCDTATKEGELYVRFDGTLSSTTNTVIEIHADGTSSEPAFDSTFGRNAVWADYRNVWHLNELSGDFVDSTGNSDFVGVNNPTRGVASPMFGECVELDGVMHLESTTNLLQSGDEVTVEAVLDTTSVDTNGVILILYGDDTALAWQRDSANDRSGFYIRSTTGKRERFRSRIGGYISNIEGQGPKFLVTTCDLNSARADWYIDGAWFSDQQDVGSQNGSTLTTMRAGRGSGGSSAFNGKHDEMRVRYGLRDADWILTQYRNQSNRDTFYTVTDTGGGPTPQNLTGTLYSDADFFGSHQIIVDQELTGTVYADPDFFGSHSISGVAPSQDLTGSIYSDADFFGSHSVNQTTPAQNLTGSVYDDPDIFFSHTISPGAVDLTGSLYSDSDFFGSHLITGFAPPQNLTGTLYADLDFFGSHNIGAEQTLTASFFSDADFFGSHALVYNQTLTGTVYDDPDFFGMHAAVQPGEEGELRGKRSIKNLREWMSLPR